MSHPLTEADVFTPTVVVPDGTDPGSGRSEDMATLAQALANRTLNLKNRIDPIDTDAARKSQANTFSGIQTINVPFVDVPILRTDSKASDSSPTNRWRLELEFPVSGSSYVGLFVGQPPDAWVLAYNARWHPDTQRWRQLDASQPSTALVQRLSVAGALGVPELKVSYKAAGSAAWVDWPPDLGGNLYVGDNLYVSGEFRYQGGAHNRVDWSVPLASCIGSGLILNEDGTVSIPTGGYFEWPLRIPAGVTISDIKVSYERAASGIGGAWLKRRGHETAGMPTYETAPPTAFGNAGAIGFGTIVVPCNGHVLDGAYDYAVRIASGHVNDKIGRIYLTWQDPGPRNLG